jgi:hypothetical protein
MTKKARLQKAIAREMEFKKGKQRLNASPVKSSDYTSPLESDVIRVKPSTALPEEIADKIHTGTQHFDTKSKQPQLSGSEFSRKIAGLTGIGKRLGKAAITALPFAGAGYAALQGDPAMAADQLTGDIPVIGQAYEALKPEEAGSSTEDRQLMAERDALVNYNNSPAAKDRAARIEALKKLQGN